MQTDSARTFRKQGGRPPRAGSILIMVVSLLVLLALMGTAMVATARLDRYASVQNTTNVQIDLLVESAINLAEQQIASDPFGYDIKFPAAALPNRHTAPVIAPSTGWFRPYSADAKNPQYTYTPIDSPYQYHYNYATNPPTPISRYQDDYLATRWPVIAGGRVCWPALSQTAFGNLYADPRGGNYVVNPNDIVEITSLTLADGTIVPALKVGATTYIAADTDGDGIADSALTLFPIGQINGVTYFVSQRIVDNGSAINVSTAWQWSQILANDPNRLAGNYFGSHIDLEGLLAANGGNPAVAMDNIAAWRRTNPDATQPMGMYDDLSATPISNFDYATGYEALWYGLGRRIQYPAFGGNNVANQQFRAYGLSDTLSMAHRFMLANAFGSESQLEKDLRTYLSVNVSPYVASAVGAWYNQNFTYGAAVANSVNLRTVLVANNPVSNQFPPRVVDGLAPSAVTSDGATNPQVGFADMAPYSSTPVATDINTATVNELFRAWWSVLSINGQSPYTYGNRPDEMMNYVSSQPVVNFRRVQQGCFRSPIRDNRFIFTDLYNTSTATVPAPATPLHMPPPQVAGLRAAIAAVNAMDLRDDNLNCSHFTYVIPVSPKDPLTNAPFYENYASGNTAVEVTVYGNEPQPFITEVLADNDNSPDPAGAFNPRGFVAIELYNPYPFPLTLNNYALALTDRRQKPTSPTSNKQLRQIGPSFSGTIPANGYLVLHNYLPPGSAITDVNAAKKIPGTFTIPAGTLAAYIKDLDQVIEVAGDPLTGGELTILKPINADGTGSGTIYDMVPVDQYDFTGYQQSTNPAGMPAMAGSKAFTSWHYTRKSAAGSFAMVYPGRYDGTLARLRQKNTEEQTYDTAPPTFIIPVNLGNADAAPAGQNPFADIKLEFQAGANPIFSQDPAFPTKLVREFPYGGFARPGDAFKTPVIGAYRIRLQGATDTFIEMNAITTDSGFADNTDDTDDVGVDPTDFPEQVGRICPVRILDSALSSPSIKVYKVNDFDPDFNEAYWSYHFAANLFECFTVNSPHDDFTPNVSPDLYIPAGGQGKNAVPNTRTAKDKGIGNPGGPNNTEEDVGVEGKINLNTAPLPVVNAIPLMYDPLAPANRTYNLPVARAIVDYRDNSRRPYRNLFELYMVTAPDSSGNLFNIVETGNGGITLNATSTYLERLEMLNRIATFSTLRSDSFTCYIMIQGWRNAGTSSAQLVAQRRVGVMVDRNSIKPGNRTLIVNHLPQE